MKFVSPGSLVLIPRWPPSSCVMIWLQARPIPMLKSLTFSKFCFILSSKNGTKSIFYRASVMPMPESMTSVLKMKSSSSFIELRLELFTMPLEG